jgi:hypothetical protein
MIARQVRVSTGAPSPVWLAVIPRCTATALTITLYAIQERSDEANPIDCRNLILSLMFLKFDQWWCDTDIQR